MKTNWSEEKTSILFDSYDDYLEDQLGYQPLITKLKEKVLPSAKIMDYGCGGGKVSRRLAAAGFGDVTGFDISKTMIAKSEAHPDRGSTKYMLVESGQIPVSSNHFDAAICCYVFINIHSKEDLQTIANEIFRVLKPGATLHILDTNANTTGLKFSNFLNGDKNAIYRDGDSRPVYLDLPDGSIFKIVDNHWEHGTYLSVLRTAGFAEVEVSEFTANDVPNTLTLEPDSPEHKHAPFAIFSCQKPKPL